MAFERVLGQEKAKQNLQRALEKDELAHAYLFEGAEGLGKKSMALDLASALLCDSNKDKPCRICNSCLRISSGNHSGLKIIEEEKVIKVDEIRELIQDIQLKPYEGEKKVYIICDADKINIQGQNALLKTLEEPPQYATIILLTTKSNSLLSTIISRCQTIRLNSVSLEIIKSYLVNEKKANEEQSQKIAAFSGGNVGKAVKLLEDVAFHERMENVIKICNDLMNTKLIKVIDKVSFFEEEKSNIEEILDFMISWYRDLLVYKETENMDLIINIDKQEEIAFGARRIDINKIRDIIFIIQKSKNNLKSNVQFHLNIEVMLLNIQEVLTKW